MRKLLVLVLAVVISGCASTSGVVPTGPDSYMISRSAGYGHFATGPVLADAYKEANEFCEDKGKKLEPVHTNEIPMSFGHYPEAHIDFMCLDVGDPQLSRPMMRTENVSGQQPVVQPVAMPISVPQPQFTPMKVYAPERPVQTTCTPGGFGSVNCTSRQTGVDASIYNH